MFNTDSGADGRVGSASHTVFQLGKQKSKCKVLKH